MVDFGLLPEALLLLFGIFSESYWQEARENYLVAQNQNYDDSVRFDCARKYGQSRRMFERANLGMAISLYLAITSIAISNFSVIKEVLKDIPRLGLSIIFLLTPAVILIWELWKFLKELALKRSFVEYKNTEELLNDLDLDEEREYSDIENKIESLYWKPSLKMKSTSIRSEVIEEEKGR